MRNEISGLRAAPFTTPTHFMTKDYVESRAFASVRAEIHCLSPVRFAAKTSVNVAQRALNFKTTMLFGGSV